MIDNGFVVVQPLHLHKVSYEINICYALKISHISVTSTSQLLSADFPTKVELCFSWLSDFFGSTQHIDNRTRWNYVSSLMFRRRLYFFCFFCWEKLSSDSLCSCAEAAIFIQFSIIITSINQRISHFLHARHSIVHHLYILVIVTVIVIPFSRGS
jgi:hypothetical protein